ncbi:MAG: amidohydrolase family protein [Isosphaeraceae bacterium]
MTATQAELDALRKRLKPPGPVIDVHVHPLPLRVSGREATPREAAEDLLAHADRAGVTRLVLMNLGRVWSTTPDPAAFRAANDDCLRIRDIAPDRFLSFCYVNPMHTEASLAELDRCIGREGMVGVKLWVAVRANDPRVRLIAEKAVALDVPILQHTWNKAEGNGPGESSPDDLAALARAVPHARLILGHLGGGGLRGIEAVVDLPQVVVETAGSDPESGIVEAAVRRLGTRRVIFGSDARGRHFATQLAKVTGANLSVAAQRRILWDNLARLLPAKAGVRPLGDTGPLPEDRPQ